MLSTPPAKTVRARPSAIFSAPKITDAKPEAQAWFKVMAGTVSGNPENSAA